VVERYPASDKSKIFSFFPLPDIRSYKVIARPEGKGKGFWAGGCSSLKDAEGKIWLVYRIRNPEKRGYKLCIASSSDGVNFQTVKELNKEQFENVESLERAFILQDPSTGRYKLYISLEKRGKWYIYKLEDAIHPEEFDPFTVKPVFSPSHERKDTRKVKDPYIINFCNSWFMFYSGSGDEPQEKVFLATSWDGERWVYRGVVLQRSFWHSYHTRLSCIIPGGKGFLCFYEGSSFSWYEPHFNLNIGLAYTTDMRNFFDLTPQGPVLSSPTKGNFSTIRYIDYVFLNHKIIFYYEAAREDDAFELRATECKI